MALILLFIRCLIRQQHPLKVFSPWCYDILSRVKDKLSCVKQYTFNCILSKPEVKTELKKLHNDSAIIPTDKASNNITVICKMYYITVLTKEITNSPTFSYISDSSSDFLDNLTRSLHANSPKDKKLPYLYATAKMHKNPSKFRFITAARNTVLADLSIAVSKCLKLFLKTAHMSYKYRINHLENCIFVMNSRDKIINAINSSNFDKIKHKPLSTWDFSTNIPHQKLNLLSPKDAYIYVRGSSGVIWNAHVGF